MITYTRAIRFEDIDAAGVIFFANYLRYCHEAMEAFFGELEGGYPHLILERKLGFPSVHVEVNYRRPLRYGDSTLINLDVLSWGESSIRFRYAFSRVSDALPVANVEQVVVTTDLSTFAKLPIPQDIQRLVARHVAT